MLPEIGSGQSFGQNKVQYRLFDWHYIKSPHFEIYFYNEEEDLAEFTAEVAEESYEQISKHLRWSIQKPISIIVYNSHNDFQQTNVTTAYMAEGIGGVTELFKNRVVIPFEGSYADFRHVIHHELVHAVINDMVYGGSVQSIVSGRQRLRIPLWVNEGLSEYLSSEWDTRADLIIRDLSLHEYMPHVRELDYYMAYKGGQSVWRYIASTYGREKIGEIFSAMKRTQNAEKGFNRALGMDFDVLTKKWHTYLKKEYWPDITGRDAIEDIARQITDHKKLKNYFNSAPAISPDGSKIAILSDRRGYAEIFLIDVMSGEEIRRVVKGNRSINFEELKWMRPGISWSPDGEKIILASKSGKQDAFHIIDIETGKSEKKVIKMDGLFTASWSPDGKNIVFIGNKGQASDLFLYNLDTEELSYLTHDVFSDTEPDWSPDGKWVAFVSDRGDYFGDKIPRASDSLFTLNMYERNYSQTNIYKVSIESGEIFAITETPYNETSPVWTSNQTKMFYTADAKGIWNIYNHDMVTGEAFPITNVLTGIQQLSLSMNDKTLVFAGYSKTGWDIYSLNNPLSLKKKEVLESQFHLKMDEKDQITDLRKDKVQDPVGTQGPGDYSTYIFAESYKSYNIGFSETGIDTLKMGPDSTFSDSSYSSMPYKTRFTLDLVSGNLYISNVFGGQGMTYFSWSDIMGDHQIYVGTEMVLSLENSDYYLSYAYLKKLTDYYITGYQTANFFRVSNISVARLRNYGVQFRTSRPFSRFNRIDLSASWSNIGYELWEPTGGDQYNIIARDKFSVLIPAINYVFDNSVSGYTGPLDGLRYNLSFHFSPKQKASSFQFNTLKFDIRKYILINRQYTLAFRAMAGKSWGGNPQKFFLGGLPYWVFGRGETNGNKDESQFRNDILDTTRQSLKDIYFTEYATPVRGARYAERTGNQVFLTNIEFRFPFINYLSLGFPAKAIFGNIRGHAFLDIGAAWDDIEEFTDSALMYERYGESIENGTTPWIVGSGLGMKINLGYLLLRIDMAWDVNPGMNFTKPQYYFSIGSDW